MSKQFAVNQTVQVKDGNGNWLDGKVLSYGPLNDGTGEHGYWIRVEDNTWGVRDNRVRRA